MISPCKCTNIKDISKGSTDQGIGVGPNQQLLHQHLKILISSFKHQLPNFDKIWASMFSLVGQNFDKNLNKASASKFQLYSRLKQERWYLQQPESHSSILNESTQGGKDTGKPITIMIGPGSDEDRSDRLLTNKIRRINVFARNHHLSESQKGGFPFSSQPKGNFWQQLFGWR